ncbi:MAG: zf-HC2 domain-containing protein [Actinomycetota bacterium]|nr:zf-HC2 domain-containing protein [Actinomycetota bacterium]
MSERNDIACRQVVELLTDYLEDALAPGDRARLEEHLSGCGGCTRVLSQLRETIALTGTLTEEQLPAELRDGLLATFRGWSAGVDR